MSLRKHRRTLGRWARYHDRYVQPRNHGYLGIARMPGYDRAALAVLADHGIEIRPGDSAWPR